MDNEKIYHLYTLYDITNTGVYDQSNGNNVPYNQEQNYRVVYYTLMFRTQIKIITMERLQLDVKGMGFGKEFKGKHNVWHLAFKTESSDPWLTDGDYVALLRQDFDQSRLCSGLESTAILDGCLINTTNNINMIFEAVDG